MALSSQVEKLPQPLPLERRDLGRVSLGPVQDCSQVSARYGGSAGEDPQAVASGSDSFGALRGGRWTWHPRSLAHSLARSHPAAPQRPNPHMSFCMCEVTTVQRRLVVVVVVETGMVEERQWRWLSRHASVANPKANAKRPTRITNEVASCPAAVCKWSATAGAKEVYE